MQIIAALIIVGSSVWVYHDAKSIGVRRGLLKGFFDMDPIEWSMCVFGCWFFLFPQYIYLRREYREIVEAPVGRGSKKTGAEEVEEEADYLGQSWQRMTIGWAVFSCLVYFFMLFLIGNELSTIKIIGGDLGTGIGNFIGGSCWFLLLLVISVPAGATYLLGRKFGQTVTVIQKTEKMPGNTRPCPYCGEEIGVKAIHCRFCAKDIDAAAPARAGKAQGKVAAGAEQAQAAPRPKNKEQWFAHGQQLLKQGKVKEAIVALSHAIREDGNNGAYYYVRAVAYTKVGDKQKSIIDLKKAANLGCEPAINYLRKLKK